MIDILLFGDKDDDALYPEVDNPCLATDFFVAKIQSNGVKSGTRIREIFIYDPQKTITFS